MRKFVFHPYLLVVYPILYLYAYNIDKLHYRVILWPLIIAFFSALLLQRLLAFIFKGEEKGGLLASIFILMFFSYGHFSNVIHDLEIFGLSFFRNRYRVLAYFMIAFPAIIWAIKTRLNLNKITKALNLIALLLVLFLLFGIAGHQFESVINSQSKPKETHKDTNVSMQNQFNPDIYYIILDGYAGSSTLKEIYNYDNKEFMDYLAKKGFYIATKSASNYAMTALSLPSSFNMEYFKSKNEYDRIKDDEKIVDFLKSHGYKCMYVSDEIANGKKLESNPDEFLLMLYKTTMIDMLAFRFNFYAGFVRKEILASFNWLGKISEIKGPKFVFLRIPSPHPPYVFGPNGEGVNTLKLSVHGDIWKSGWDDRESYLNQLIFISKKTEKVVESILKKSEKPPIIILQADHGPAFTAHKDDRYKFGMKILNAYYLPHGGSDVLYNTITPVNTFRVIFNYYFGAKHELLSDENYFSTFEKPFNFINVTNILK
jgi:hypothetical protein